MELAKRASKADGNIGASGGDSAEALERRYVSLDEAEAEETPRKAKRAATQAQTERGDTALSIARTKGDEKVIRLLGGAAAHPGA